MLAQRKASGPGDRTARGRALISALARKSALLAAVIAATVAGLHGANAGPSAQSAHALERAPDGRSANLAWLAGHAAFARISVPQERPADQRPVTAARPSRSSSAEPRVLARATTSVRALTQVRHAYLRTTRGGGGSGGHPLRERRRAWPALGDTLRHAFLRARLSTSDMVSKGGLGADRSTLHSTNNSP